MFSNFDPTDDCIALNRALIFSHLIGIPEEETVHLSILVTSLTLHHPGAVRSDLTRKLLLE
jgi:hypothetical protein